MSVGIGQVRSVMVPRPIGRGTDASDPAVIASRKKGAIYWINLVRERAGASDVWSSNFADDNALLQFILDERARELVAALGAALLLVVRDAPAARLCEGAQDGELVLCRVVDVAFGEIFGVGAHLQGTHPGYHRLPRVPRSRQRRGKPRPVRLG